MTSWRGAVHDRGVPGDLATAVATLGSGLALAYADRGDPSQPTVLFLPGPTDSWHSYRPVLDAMPPDVRAVAVSPRGHGDSDKPPSGFSISHLAADVVPFLDALGVERAVLAGHSASCFVARRVALDQPDRVTGVVLEASPTTLRGDPGLQAFVESLLSTLEDPISPELARSFVVDTSADHLPADLLDVFVSEVLKVPAHVWREMFTALLEHDDLVELPNLSVPALLIWGDADALVSRTMQDELVRQIPRAELVVYPGVSHAPRWEDPSRFAHDVAGFTREVRRAR